MTKDELRAMTKKELADLARGMGVEGWHRMRKEDLFDALLALARKIRSKTRPRKSRHTAKPQRAAARDTSGNGSPEQVVESAKYDVGVPTRDLSARVPRDLPAGYGKDKIVLMVRDPYWLHTYWELSHQSIQRAEAALGQDWHTAKPILRVFDVSANDTTSTSEAVVKDIDIHGGCQNCMSRCSSRRGPTAWTWATSRSAASSS